MVIQSVDAADEAFLTMFETHCDVEAPNADPLPGGAIPFPFSVGRPAPVIVEEDGVQVTQVTDSVPCETGIAAPQPFSEVDQQTVPLEPKFVPSFLSVERPETLVPTNDEASLGNTVSSLKTAPKNDPDRTIGDGDAPLPDEHLVSAEITLNAFASTAVFQPISAAPQQTNSGSKLEDSELRRQNPDIGAKLTLHSAGPQLVSYKNDDSLVAKGANIPVHSNDIRHKNVSEVASLYAPQSPTPSEDIPLVQLSLLGAQPLQHMAKPAHHIAENSLQFNRFLITALPPLPSPSPAGIAELTSRLVWADEVTPLAATDVAGNSPRKTETTADMAISNTVGKPESPSAMLIKMPEATGTLVETTAFSVDMTRAAMLLTPSGLPPVTGLVPTSGLNSFSPIHSHPSPAIQIAAALSQATDGRVELILAPEELGLLRIEMTPDGDALRITVAVERPETLEMFRRHTDTLLTEIRQAGFSGAQLSFGNWGGQKGTDTAQNQALDMPSELPQSLRTPDDFCPPTGNIAIGNGLDLRL